MEETTTFPPLENFPYSEDETLLLVVSSGDAVTTNPGTTSAGVTDGDAAGVQTPYIIYTGTSEADAQLMELLQEIHTTQTEILTSNQRIELQNEASISILLIFLVVGLLNYIYKFFKMFF